MWCERIGKFFRTYTTVPGVVVVFALTFVLMLAVQSGEAGAAWVQAIGSIAAILAAMWIANIQSAAQKKEADGLRQVAVKALIELSDRACFAVVMASHKADEGELGYEEAQGVRESLKAYSAVDIFKLPFPKLIEHVLFIKGNLECALEQTDRIFVNGTDFNAIDKLHEISRFIEGYSKELAEFGEER